VLIFTVYSIFARLLILPLKRRHCTYIYNNNILRHFPTSLRTKTCGVIIHVPPRTNYTEMHKILLLNAVCILYTYIFALRVFFLFINKIFIHTHTHTQISTTVFYSYFIRYYFVHSSKIFSLLATTHYVQVHIAYIGYDSRTNRINITNHAAITADKIDFLQWYTSIY